MSPRPGRGRAAGGPASSVPPLRRVLIFAHRPPPVHGQSLMVGLMLDLAAGPQAASDGTPGAGRFEFHHVDVRLSSSLEDVGVSQPGKLPRLLAYCARAVWLRWRHGIRAFYYVPAPPARTPVLRDWLVMALCRPFFRHLVLHWHAGGLSGWLESQTGRWTRAVTRRLLGYADLSLVLRPYHRRDAEYFRSRQVVVLPNGIPDPCPDFDQTVRGERERRARGRRRLLALEEPAGDAAGDPGETRVFRVLFLSACRREKGLFDLLDAVALANRQLERTPLRLQLTVAGDFASADDRQRFAERLEAPDLVPWPGAIRHVGFVEGAAKDALLRESDCLCLPTYLPEGLPVVLIEAMAYGLAPITTTWCDLAEVLPPGYPGAVPARSPEALAAKLVEFAGREYAAALRAFFLSRYTAAEFMAGLENALAGLGTPQPAATSPR